LFAGQGAQYPGMGRSAYDASPRARALMDALEVLRPGTLRDCFEPEGGAPSETKALQPCLYAVDLACALYAEEAGIHADCAAGFSLGEIPAAAYAGAYGAEEGFTLAVERGAAMQACAQRHPGCMYALLRCPPEWAEAVCAGLPNVYPVNYNTREQIVIAMSEASEGAFLDVARTASLRAVKLKVGGAFHTPFMRAATEALGALLQDMPLKSPRIALYSNVTGEPYGPDVAALLAAQASSPVRWRAAVEHMILSGVDTFVEVGPGSVLTGLVKKIDPNVLAVNVEDAQTLERALGALARGVEA
jgi:[acyl-carrier-protein] S-malonyltransferase